jgi:hypothetical protein
MWHNKYIGLPYKHNGRDQSGIDCWGLARLVYQEQFGIDLPSLVADYEGDSGKNIRELVNIQKESWQLVNTPEVPDLCVFRILGQPIHIGIYTGNRNFLHINEGHTSIIESLDSPKWAKRLEGIYRYSSKRIQLTGAPHPLQNQIATDWVAAGKNLEELSIYIKQKYQISDRLFERIVILVDGVPVDKIYWHTRVLLPGETVAYRVLAGKNAVRTIATIALVIAVYTYAPMFATYVTGATSGLYFNAVTIATAFAMSYVGGKLINAIAPVRMPDPGNDPGTPGTLNLFNGTTNQMNRFGAIPVVLGRVRMTGVLGAQPYIHSLENSNNISTILIWGFGPLLIEDLQIGTIPIASFYNDLTTGTLSQLAPAHLYGYSTEDQDSFNNLYGQEIQQVYASAGGPVELVNNDTLGNPWTEISLTDEVTSMALSFTFPQGCRAINVKDGKISTAQTDIEIQYKTHYQADGVTENKTNWITTGTYATSVNSNLLTQQTKTWVVPIPAPIDFPETTTNPDYPTLYQWFVISIGQGGRLTMSEGTPTNDPASSVPPRDLKSYFYQKNFASLSAVAQPWVTTGVYKQNDLVKYNGVTYASLQDNNTNHPPNGTNFNVYWAYPDPSSYYLYAVKPQIPQGDIKLYEFCLKTGVGLFGSVVDFRGTVNVNYTGFNLTVTNNTNNTLDWVQQSAGSVTVTMAGGKLTSSGYATGTENLIFNGTSFSNVAAYSSSTNTISTWSPLLINNGIWSTTGDNVTDFNATVTFPVTGYYTIEMAVVGTASLYIAGADYNSPNNTGFIGKFANSILDSYKTATAKLPLDVAEITPVLNIDNNFFGTKFTTTLNVTQGSRKIRLISRGDAPFSAGGTSYAGRVALRITYIAGGDLNPNPQTTNKLSIGIAGTYEKRKDPFNYTYWFYNLPKAKYDIRVRRANSDKDEEGDLRLFYNVQVNSLTGYSNNGPTNNPPGCYLAKSAIRLESTGKVNGSVDGINALVTTKTYDWNGTGWNNSDPNTPVNTLSNGTHWVPDQPTNNPASLFIYVLTHCANAYAVPITKVPSQIDLLKLQEWHTFCFVKKLAFNNVLTNTQSVMDTLRDICAAGLASPAMVNGKWTVVIDRPRPYVTQYFTPHNSWGFESTKTLPRLPDALRITIQDESKAYQPDEFFVYRDGFTESTAKIYEQISFPGVTNKAQAIYLAKFHLAQAKLRPETYSLNVDFEHLVCTRGDLVRVSHDIPEWGIGTGRITKIENPTASTTKLTLSEQFYIEPNKIYIIRIRTVQGAVVKTFSTPVAVGAAQYINEITINEQLLTLSTPPQVDNLYMLGITTTLIPTTYTDSQELVVLAVETQPNNTARLTLTDYSPTLYDDDFSNDVFLPNITGAHTDVLIQRIIQTPIIINTDSDPLYAVQISPGIYQNTLVVAIGHPNGLPALATKIQLAIVEAEAQFNDDTLSGVIVVDKSQSSFSIPGLISTKGYKIKVRYSNATGSITGPWSYPPVTVSITGKSGAGSNTIEPPLIDVYLDDHYIYANPLSFELLNNSDFKTFEYRVYRNPGSGDFWQLGTGLTDIKSVQTRGPGRINIMEFDLGSGVDPKPRLSFAGVQYRVACRTVDTNNNYSLTSSLGVVIVTHIK